MHSGELLGLLSSLTKTVADNYAALLGMFSNYLPLTGGTVATLTVTNNTVLGGSTVTKNVSMTGNVTVATTVPVSSGNGGVLVVVRGADISGIAFTKLYLVAVRVGGGAVPDLAAVLVGTAGTATPSFTFTNVAGFMNITSASNNIATASTFGG